MAPNMHHRYLPIRHCLCRNKPHPWHSNGTMLKKLIVFLWIQPMLQVIQHTQRRSFSTILSNASRKVNVGKPRSKMPCLWIGLGYSLQYVSSIASWGSRDAKKKANLLYHWRGCGKGTGHRHIHQQALLCCLTGFVTLVSGLRLDTSCTVATVCCVINLYKVLCLKHTENE